MKFLRIVKQDKTEYLYNPLNIHIEYAPQTELLRIITSPQTVRVFKVMASQYEELLDILDAAQQDDVSTFDLNEWDEVENAV